MHIPSSLAERTVGKTDAGGQRGEIVWFEIQSHWSDTLGGWGFADRAPTIEEAAALYRDMYLPRVRNGNPQYRIVKKTEITGWQ